MNRNEALPLQHNEQWWTFLEFWRIVCKTGCLWIVEWSSLKRSDRFPLGNCTLHPTCSKFQEVSAKFQLNFHHTPSYLLNEINNCLVVFKINFRPIYLLSLVFFLFYFEEVFVEKLLQLLIREIDAKLFKTVVIKDLKSFINNDQLPINNSSFLTQRCPKHQ